MVKKNRKLSIENQTLSKEQEISEKTEKIFKFILKTMTWVTGICFLLIIIFHLFNNESLDIISKALYFIGIIILIAFTIIEFNEKKVKLKIQQFTEVSS